MHEQSIEPSSSFNAPVQRLNFPTLNLDIMTLDEARGNIQQQLMLLAAGGNEEKGMEWLISHMSAFRVEYPTAGQSGEDRTRTLIARWNAADSDGRLTILMGVKKELEAAVKN